VPLAVRRAAECGDFVLLLLVLVVFREFLFLRKFLVVVLRRLSRLRVVLRRLRRLSRLRRLRVVVLRRLCVVVLRRTVHVFFFKMTDPQCRSSAALLRFETA